MRTDTARRVALLGVFVALGMILSYIEAMFPIVASMPGIRIGLSNALVVYLLYNCDWKDACIYQVTRILLSFLLFGNLFALTYSAAGAVCSMTVMLLIKRIKRFDTAGVSACGGLFHNLGQFLVAYILMGAAVVTYLPVLVFSGVLSGYLIGWLSALLMRYNIMKD
ncbi:MAG: Gx transporter family protein [Lachnospiraceae bacterium]|nr:Gx transporter family protein [Lachnospiraceae bacterium]